MMDSLEDTNNPFSVPTMSIPSPTSGTTIEEIKTSEIVPADNSLLVDIEDATCEQENVMFTVHTKTTLKQFKKSEFLVVRLHEEFVWLHDRYNENEQYTGYSVPLAPPRPDFSETHEKLLRMRGLESTLSTEDFLRMKEELEEEYLVTFKKTVAMHEEFLQRLASNPVFRNDSNLRLFLECKRDLRAKPRTYNNVFTSLYHFVRSRTSTPD